MFNNSFGYTQPMYQQQQYYQQPRPVTIPAMFVDDINQIRPSDIPMDGRPSIFVVKDYSAVYLKQWNANGTIDTLRLVPEINTLQPALISNDMGQVDVLKRLDAIEKLLMDNGFVRKEE